MKHNSYEWRSKRIAELERQLAELGDHYSSLELIMGEWMEGMKTLTENAQDKIERVGRKQPEGGEG